LPSSDPPLRRNKLSQENMNVTVILCTYNRCESLEKTLRSVAATVMPNSTEWEILVVDNNSTDGTRAVVERFYQKHPSRFRYLYEPKPGKSNALNAGIRDARGDVLAFLDDDVVVEVNWLKNLTAPLRGSEWAGVGGRIIPGQDFKPPRWIPLHERYALAPLAMFDLGLQPSELLEAPFGTNMAFRKAVFGKLGGFRTDLGPRPGSAIRSEDTEFGFRVLADGQRLWYEPSAVVYHSLPADRLEKQYFLSWWHDKARADIRTHGIPTDTKWYAAGIPLYLFRRFVVWAIRWLGTLNPARRFSCKLKVWGVTAQIKECYRLTRNPSSPGQTPSIN
jgi:glycosyltransferase involved in cell wall biosynthesis